jgi:hypothetical protein
VNEVVVRYNVPVTAAGIPQPGTISVDGVRSDYAVTLVTQLDPRTFVLHLDRSLGIQPAAAGGGCNGERVTLTVPGAGAAGGNYGLTLQVLQGDADRIGDRVTTGDYSFTRARLKTSASDPAGGGAQYSPFADVNASGDIRIDDATAVRARLNDDLPVLAASQASAIASSSITRKLFRAKARQVWA